MIRPCVGVEDLDDMSNGPGSIGKKTACVRCAKESNGLGHLERVLEESVLGGMNESL